jgi:hypothetical protein
MGYGEKISERPELTLANSAGALALDQTAVAEITEEVKAIVVEGQMCGLIDLTSG